jgi:alpha-1,3-glucan synthase
MRFSTLLGLAPFIASALAAPYNETYADYNLNTNQNAQSPLDYDSSFTPSSYTPSPDSWRIPFYTILMDKFADGDPTNNDYFKTEFEWDWRETNFRYGGDLAGLESKLDYLAGMGIKAIFAAGTPWINMLWQADSASVLFFFVLFTFSTPTASIFYHSYRGLWRACAGVTAHYYVCLQVTRPWTLPLSIRTGVDVTNGAR